MRLEGCLNHSRESQEHLINLIREEQLKFQSDFRSVVTKSLVGSTLDPSLNQGGSAAGGVSGGGNRMGFEQLGFGRAAELGGPGGHGGFGVRVLWAVMVVVWAEDLGIGDIRN